MALNRGNISDREYHKFVESPSRPGEPAVEVKDVDVGIKLDQLIILSGGSSTNIRSSILAAADRVQQIIYADFGNKNQRVLSIAYTSATVGAYTATKTFTYSLVGNRYRRDTITWVVT